MSSAEVSSLQAEEKAEGDDESWLYGGKSHCQLEVQPGDVCSVCGAGGGLQLVR